MTALLHPVATFRAWVARRFPVALPQGPGLCRGCGHPCLFDELYCARCGEEIAAIHSTLHPVNYLKGKP